MVSVFVARRRRSEFKFRFFSDKNYDFNGRHQNELTRRQIDMNLSNQNLLAAITTTGVLLPPLIGNSTSLDFVFVLNVRESELYPPLFMPGDLACIEDKISAYRAAYPSEGELLGNSRINFEFSTFHFAGLSNEDLIQLEKQFLKQCLKIRLPNLQLHNSRFESQIVVTRISITCSCDDLKTGESCSTFNSIDKQKWTEFMGNTKHGFYPGF